jgi:HAD superfamily hydrolase (TIGR01493 family)
MHALAAGRVRGIVFDLWNTLAFNDHRPNPIIAIGEAFGLTARPGWTKSIEEGMMRERLPGIREGLGALSRFTGNPLGAAQVEALVTLWTEACRRTRLFPDVEGSLERLASRYRLGLLSNTQSFDLEFLEGPGVASRFDARLLSCDSGTLKPDPTLFLKMAERLRLVPAQLLMVGDNLADDVRAAEAVGMQAVLLRRYDAPLSFQESAPDRAPIRDLEPLLVRLGV